ncbi:MAG: hypothetical protein ABIE94_04880 [archaeon]
MEKMNTTKDKSFEHSVSLKLNKKGQRAMVIGIAILVLVLVFIVFAVIFSFYGKALKAIIEGEFDDTRNDMMFLNYLRSPVELGGKELIVADIIALYESGQGTYNRQDLKDAAWAEAEVVLRTRVCDECYKVYVKGGDFQIGKKWDPLLDETQEKCVIIPGIERDKAIEVCMVTEVITFGTAVKWSLQIAAVAFWSTR